MLLFCAVSFFPLAWAGPGGLYGAFQERLKKPDLGQRISASAPEIETHRNVVWARVDHEDLLLDVFLPRAGGIHPMVVNIHGGGWTFGSKEMDEALCKYLAERGYVVFNINYRLAPVFKFPAQVNDGLGAVIWAKDHAEKYSGDRERVAVMGDSAGGNLSAMVAFAHDNPNFSPTYTSSHPYNASVQAAVLIYGVYDMTQFDSPRNKWIPFFYSYLGGPEDLFPERYMKASPVEYLKPGKRYPVVLIIGGDKDSLYAHSVELKNELEERGIKYAFYTARGGHHGFISVSSSKPARETMPVIGDFLDRELKGIKTVKLSQGTSQNRAPASAP
jgi:acetyl esterase/lipase